MNGKLCLRRRAGAFRIVNTCLFVLLLGLPPSGRVAGQVSTIENPNRVKAAFLRNFAHYVKWPATAFDSAQSPWHIGVLGSASFGEVLESTLRGRTEHNRGFEIHSADSLKTLPSCQIIFIAFEDSSKRRAVLTALKEKPVLTVGDAAEILREGGIVRFQLGDRVQMSVNLDQARAASLNVPTEMLEVSTEVLEHGVLRRMR
jgi:hypothetical protein